MMGAWLESLAGRVFLKDQRRHAQLWFYAQLADGAGVSNPYLSQIERGVRKPSAMCFSRSPRPCGSRPRRCTSGLASSTSPTSDHSVQDAVLADTLLSERQKRVLLDVYETFRKENDDER